MSHVELYHFESRTRESKVHPWEHERVLNRWGSRDVDPYLPLQYGRPPRTQRLGPRRRLSIR
jgi:hypothetical protein